MASSLVIHTIAAALCLTTLSGPSRKKEEGPASKAVGLPFVPLVAPPRYTPKQVVVGGAGRLDPPPAEMPEVMASSVTVNLNSIKLEFAPDIGNQLPEVVQSRHGMLALLEKGDLTIARYFMEPPDWQLHPTFTDVSGRPRFRMDPPGKWAIFRDAASRSGIDLDQFVGCAIFDASFFRCLRTEIQSQSANASGTVSSVNLAFAKDRSCGIEVQGVEFAKPTPER